MELTIKDLKELIDKGKTSDNKYKLDHKTDLVELFSFDKDFSYFDITFKNMKKELFFLLYS